MAAGTKAAGRILEQSAGELLRIWRLARAASRSGVFPGLLDGVMASFFSSAGAAMAAGSPPEDVWKGVSGMIRTSDTLGAAELTAEWAVAMEVLAAVCESFSAEPAVAEWLARAVAGAERATTGLSEAKASAPSRVLEVHILGEMPPPRRVRASAEADG